ncbi:MAG: hypothetical protein K1X79_12260 [Oligoflexia bacterium]|nr:hypothetical protein [Oligoflexia bacterium]
MPTSTSVVKSAKALYLFGVVGICLLGLPAVAQDLKEFTDPSKAFQLNFNSVFELMPPSSPNVALSLRHRANGYPTFNIIRESCSPALLEKGPAEQAERLASEYRHVGLTDTLIRENSSQTFDGNKAFAALLSYHNQGKAYLSAVMRILVADQCLVTTFIDEESSFETNRYLLAQLQNGLKILNTQAPEEKSSSSAATSIGTYFFGSLVVLFAAFCLLRRRRNIPS